VFAYEIKNGELLRQGAIRDRTPKNHLKRSFTLSETTASNNSNIPQISSRSNQPSAEVNYLLPRSNTNEVANYIPRSNTNELRTTYSAKSPFR